MKVKVKWDHGASEMKVKVEVDHDESLAKVELVHGESEVCPTQN